MSDEHNGGGQSAPDRSASNPQAKESANQPQSAARETAKPKIGDKRPAPTQSESADENSADQNQGQQGQKKGNRNRRRRRSGGGGEAQNNNNNNNQGGNNRNRGNGGGGEESGSGEGGGQRRRRRRGGRGRGGGGSKNTSNEPVTALTGEAVELDEETLAMRKGRERKGKPAGRYMMCVLSLIHISEPTRPY